MSQFGTQSNNPPWARTNGPPLGQPGQLQTTPMVQHSLLNQQVNFQQQQQVYQQSIQNIQQQHQQQQPTSALLGQQIQLGDKNKGYAAMSYPFQAPQMGGLAGSIATSAGLQPLHTMQTAPQQASISYPAPRGIRSFTNQPPPLTNVITTTPQAAPQQSQIPQKNRVFTGVITKVHENFGFIDEDVFFNLSVVAKGLPPIAGERALVDATYNANMPFKWNATRVQVLPSERQNFTANMSGYNAVPPPQFNPVVSGTGGGNAGNKGDSYASNDSGHSRPQDRRRDNMRRESREREREVERDRERERERERRRDDRLKEREKEREKEKRYRSSRSPSTSSRRRSRSPRANRVASRSPPRRRARVMPRYVMQIPKISLDSTEASMPELKRRYTNLYLPSDFFVSNFRWVDAFPAHRPFSLSRTSAFHVMHKDVDEIITNDAVLEPHDADYSFSAKVMLISIPSLDELYRKSCALAEDFKDNEERDGYVHPTRLINFLVGVRGKTKETMAIGGPWSPSLDGSNPDKDPSVLIKTAIRTCKALTGVDLSPCTQWYRFVEIYYHRSETTHKGKVIPPRVETVVLFLPDVWSCLPTRLEWESLQLAYKKQLNRKLSADDEPEPAEPTAAASAAEEAAENQKDEEKMEVDAERKLEPTHFSELDVKVMKVSEMRQELDARTLNSKGLKSQLVARLTKALKTEQEQEEAGVRAAEQAAAEKAAKAEELSADPPTDESLEKKDESDKKKSSDDKEKQARFERRFALPENPHIIVHPSKTAKSGKFDCTLMSLSLLLDYRQEDTKEHSFEISLFAELFNEMLRRDFGFHIYRAFDELPDKPKEEDKDKEQVKSEKKEEEGGKAQEKPEEKEIIEDEDDKEDGQSCSSGGSKKKEPKEKDVTKEGKEAKEKSVKKVTIDPSLLLAFVYFDQSHCGYILHKDLEEIIYTLGLNLSRAQIKRLLQKVVTRDTFNYRKLTDKSESEQTPIKSEDDNERLQLLSSGNHQLLPIFEAAENLRGRKAPIADDEKISNSGIIIFKGCVVDVEKLLLQIERSEKSRVHTEEKMVQLEKNLAQTKDSAKSATDNANKLSEQLKECKSKLNETEETLKKEKEKNECYISALNKVNAIVHPIFIKQEH